MVFRCELGVLVITTAVVLAVFCCGVGILVGVGRAVAFEAGGVGCGLGAQLSEVEVRAGFVAEIHRFVEAALGVESVEDDAVDGDCDDFDDDLDEGAD